MISRLMSPLNIGEKGAEAEHHFVVQLCRHLIFRPQFTRARLIQEPDPLDMFQFGCCGEWVYFSLFLFLSLPF